MNFLFWILLSFSISPLVALTLGYFIIRAHTGNRREFFYYRDIEEEGE